MPKQVTAKRLLLKYSDKGVMIKIGRNYWKNFNVEFRIVIPIHKEMVRADTHVEFMNHMDHVGRTFLVKSAA